MRRQKYPDTLIERLVALRREYTSWQEVAEIASKESGVKFTIDAVRKQVERWEAKRRNGAESVPVSDPGPPVAVVDDADFAEKATRVVHQTQRPVEQLTYKDCLDGFMSAADFRRQFSINYRRVKCTIDTTTPIALCFISDVHIGSPYCDYAAFKRDIDNIIARPNFYLGKGGDWCDKMSNFRDRTAAVGQLHPETLQLITVERIIQAMDGRVVAAVGGNHDRMDARQSGVSSEYWIHRGKPFPYMPQGGLIELTVGSVTYRIVWTHQYGVGNSRLNKHNVFRWLRQELDATADIFVLEHQHDPSVMTHGLEEFRNHKVYEVRTGGYKIDDPFSQQFYKAGRPAPQTLVLHPDEKDVTMFEGRRAIEKADWFINGGEKAKWLYET